MIGCEKNYSLSHLFIFQFQTEAPRCSSGTVQVKPKQYKDCKCFIRVAQGVLFNISFLSDALAQRVENNVAKVDSSVDITPVVRFVLFWCSFTSDNIIIPVKLVIQHH